MKTFQVLRDLCALIVTAVVRWLSNVIRVPAAGCVLAAAAATVWPVQYVLADTVVLHVNIDRQWPSMHPEDGESWLTAFRFLQDALVEAEELLAEPTEIEKVEIWVAEGVYRADQNKNNKDENHPDPNMVCDPEFDSDCCPPYGNCNDQEKFLIKTGPIAILGGFPPTGNPTEEHRDPVAHPTILDGDLEQNSTFCAKFVDGNLELTPGNFERNSWVVLEVGPDGQAVIDGLIIRRAKQYGVRVHGDLEVRDCVIKENLWSGINAGGSSGHLVPDPDPSLVVYHSTIIHNGAASAEGGGVSIDGRAATFIDTEITQNLSPLGRTPSDSPMTADCSRPSTATDRKTRPAPACRAPYCSSASAGDFSACGRAAPFHR